MEPEKSFLPAARSGREKNLSRRFLLALVFIALAAFIAVVRIFLLPVVLAAVFATLFYPLYRHTLRVVHRPGPSALLCSLLLFLCLLIPLILISNIIAVQAVQLYETAEPQIEKLLRPGGGGLTDTIRSSRLFQSLHLDAVDWEEQFRAALKMFSGAAVKIINKTSQATLGILLDILILFFTMFYFFRDGRSIVEAVKSVIPLSEENKEKLIARFSSISRATIKVTLIIGLMQGTLGGLTLLIFDVRTWLLWGVVMAVFAILPIFGAWLVLVPAGIIMMLSGNLWQGIVVIAISTLIISVMDDMVRPRLVGHDVKMHDLLIFLSTLGGIGLFGVMGFIVGPMIAALFLSILDMYRAEFLINEKGGFSPTGK